MPKSAIYTPVEPPVEVRKPGGTPYNCLYGEAPPQRGTLLVKRWTNSNLTFHAENGKRTE